MPQVVNFCLLWWISFSRGEFLPCVVNLCLMWWTFGSCGEFLTRVGNFFLVWWISASCGEFFFLMWWVSVLCDEFLSYVVKRWMSIGIYVVPEYRNNQFINVSFLWWIPSLCGEFRTGLRHEFPDLWIREIVPIYNMSSAYTEHAACI